MASNMLSRAGKSVSTLTRRYAGTSASTSTSTSTAPMIDPSSSATPTHYLITQVRSAIGLPHPIKKTLAVLGLRRRQHSVLHPFSGPVAGQILKVKELVTVRNVTLEQGELLMVRRRPEGDGVVPTGRVYGGLSASQYTVDTIEKELVE